MGTILRPKSPSTLADQDYARYKKENPINPEDILADIKSANIKDIKSYAGLFEKSMQKDNLVAFGNRDSLKEVKDYFDQIIDLNN